MTALHIPTCYQCELPLPPRPPGTPGPPRRFCSNRCRKRAYRARQQYNFALAPAGAAELPQLPQLPPRPDADTQVGLAIAEARGAAVALARVAPEARRSLGWRCEEAAKAIAAAIDDYFPGVF